MKNFFRSKKFVGFSSLVLATSLVVGTLAIRRSKDGNGLKIGSSTVYADENLLDYDSASLINYSTILGRAIDYGILSDTVDQKGHMETTYATNKFINPQAANNCDVDLAGSKPAQFIIASVENGSKARFGQTYAMSEMDFVIDTTYDMSAHEDDYFVYDDTCKANVLYRTYDYSVLKQNVDSMIGKIVKQSDILAAKSAFDGDSIATKRGDSGATIDLSDPQYKDATIYINVEGGSNLEKAIQKSDGLLIIKDPSTNVVFNMLGNGPLELCQYRVEIIDDGFTMDEANGKEKKVEGKESNYSFDSTTTCSGEDSLHNAHVEKYMTKSIIWNIRNASSVKYNTTAGLFLVPTNITGDVTGSSAGWIASAGRTIVSSGEFHYIHHDRSDLGNTTDTSVLHFAARKGFVSSYARNAQGKIEELTNVKLSEGEYKFSFTETESDYSTPKQDGVSNRSISVDAFSKITFPDITVDVKTIDPNIPQKRYFVVKENPTTPSDPNIELSKGEIDIELSIENIDGIIHYTVNTKKYFTEKTSPTQPEDDGDTNIQASGAEFSLGAFLNKYNKKEAELTLKKEISGDAPDASKTYRIAVKKGSQFVQNDGSLGGAEHYFQVPADGTGIKIEGLVPGEYTIVEDEGNIQGFNLTGTTMSAKVTTGETTTGPSDITSDGKITLSADSKGEVTVTNTYEQVNVTGKASITLEKQIELDGKPCAVSDLPEELASKEFEFVVFVQSTNQYVTDSFGALGSDSQKKIFKVKPGETVTIYGLDPNKEYQVKELMDYNKFIVLNGYTLSGISINGADQSNFYNAIATVTTGAADSDTKAETVNSYNSIKKNLSVTKRFVLKNNSSQSVLNDLEEASLDAIKLIVSGSNGYTHEITGEELRNNGWTVVIPNVPAGPCTITEINGNGTSTNALTFSDYEVTGSSPTKDNDGQLTVTNNYSEIHTGQLQLQKIVQSNGVATPSNYEVYIQNSEGKYYNPTTGAFDPSAPDGNNPTVTVPANGSNSIVLPEGEYTITEKEESAAVPGSSHVVSYKAGNKEGSNVVDLKQHGGQITITNTYTKYSIKVTKQEAGDHMYNNWTYEFWIKDTSRTDGTYYIAKDGSSVRLEDGKEPYYFSIKAGDANSVDIPVMNAGNYQVIEKDENVAANNAFALVTTYSPAGGNIALNDQNTSANVTITNTYEYINHGSLKITKNLSGAGADPDKVFDIEVAFSMPVKYSVDGASPIATASDTYTAHLKAGESVVLSKIPAGVTYTVTETIDAADAAAGYSLDDIDGDTNKAIVKGEQNEVSVNNAYASAETIDLTVKKVWVDGNNQDGIRPASLEVALLKDGSSFRTVTLNEGNSWTETVKDLPKYEGSRLISYSWSEPSVTGYTSETSSETAGKTTTTTFTNTHVTEVTSATVRKDWDDKNNAAGKRPAELKVTLSNGTEVILNEGNNWTAKVENLPKYADGSLINYSWTEATLPAGYTMTGNAKDSADPTLTVITNKYDLTVETVSVSVQKIWDDKNDAAGKRPANLKVTLSNGTEVTLNDANNWTAKIENLPKFDANGTLIDYSWSEQVPDGYKLASTVKDANDPTLTKITNNYDLSQEKTSAKITKNWEDFNNVAGKRPAELKVILSNGTEVTLNEGNNWTATVNDLPKFDANGTLIDYTWSEPQLPEGYRLASTVKDANDPTHTILTNTYDLTREKTSATVIKNWVDKDNIAKMRPTELKVTLSNGTEVTLNDGNNWTATIDDLPKFDASGKLIDYTWTENAVNDYTAASSESDTVTTITNTFDFTSVKVDLSVKKDWQDFNNVAGKRPGTINVNLMRDGLPLQMEELSDRNNWTVTIGNLDKYDANGNEYVYTWTEEANSEGYTMTGNAPSQSDPTLTIITNTYDLSREKTSVSVQKIWDDKNDAAGKRPAELKVTLSNGTEVTLSDANNWTYTVSGLPKYDSQGKEIAYSWTEATLPAGYTMTGNKTDSTDPTLTVITNKYDLTVETVSVSVQKIWDDKNDAAGKRPSSLKVTLSNGTEVTLNDANSWTAKVENLPKFDANGTLIDYSWSEQVPDGYKLASTVKDANDPTLTKITNNYDLSQEKTSATITKNWEDFNNVAGKRPAELKVILSNGTEVTLNEGNNWTATVNDLPKFDANGTLIDYTWNEPQLPEGYRLTSTAKDLNDPTLTIITNTYDLSREKTSVSVQKIWDDKNDAAGKRPAELKVTLSNGTEVTLSDANNWTYTVSGLPKYDSQGKEIAYSWTEEALPAGYTMTGNKADSTDPTLTVITNKYDLTVETVSVSVQKIWDDKNDAAGKRPSSLKVTLSNGTEVTLNDANSWTAKVENLPKFDANGTLIDYSWSEQVPDGYTLASTVKDANDPTLTKITNNYDLSTEKTAASVTKVWDDQNNVAGKRPDSVSVNLLQNGTIFRRATLNSANSWKASYNDLPKFNDAGTAYTYTWEEVNLPSGYKAVATPSGTDTILTNTYDLSTEKVSASVEKIWDDSNNQDGKRPTSVTVHLKQNGVNFGDAVTLSEANNWTATKDNLPKYDASANEYVYTWEEDAVTDYTATSSVNGNVTTITNKHEAEKTTLTVKKVWEHKTNAAANYPASVTVELYANNAKIDTVTLNAANRWTQDVSNLPVYDNGQKITYEWKETAVANYNTTYAENAGTTTITNTYDLSTEKVSATVKKVWDDSNNQDGIRPTSVTVHLQQNGVNFGEAVTLNEANNWTATKDNLPKYDASNSAYTYTWAEDAVTDYTATSSVSGNVTTITNKHEAEKTTLTVKKVWEHKTNAAANYPASVTVELYANNAKIDTVTLNAANRWTQDVSNLPVYDNGQKITYEWKETAVANYNTTYAENAGTTTITNTFDTSTERTEATVKKVWDDSNNQDGIRPASVTVHLQQNGVNFGEAVTLNEANNWTATKDNLPKYDASNSAYTYTWVEDAVTDYAATSSVNGNVTTITNKHTAEVVSVSVEKIWDDSNNQDGIRPASLDVKLQKNGADLKTVTLNEANGWSYTEANLPKNENGTAITYTWSEPSVTGYTSTTTVSGNKTTLTNKHTAEVVSVTVEKVWDDSNDQDGLRPASLDVTLQKNGADLKTVTLNEANSWSYTETNLPKNENGTAITYTWSEPSVTGYTSGKTESGNKTTFTNSHTAAVISLTVEKAWDDNNNQDGIRPSELKVTLLKNDVDYAEVTLNDANNWTATVDNLPAKSGAQENVYKWEEKTVPTGYTFKGASKSGSVTTLINEHAAEEITLTVEKVWEDNGNVAGQRPASLKVTLNADGAYYADVTLDETNNWTATKTVPKYNNGTEVSYSWEEDVLPQGYTKTSTVNGNTTTLINTYDLSREKTSVTVKKVWDDNNNADGKRPASLEMTLSNGTVVTLSDANGWSATVDDLAKYDSNGTEITYTWTEGAMPQEYSKTGEETVGNTTTFTNTYTAPAPVLGSLKIEKILGADAPASAASKTYHFTVTGPNGYKKDVEIQGAGTVELTDLELGIYTITENEEDAKIDGYTLSVSNNGVSVELTDATQKTEQITNNYTKNTEPTQTQPTDTQPTDTNPTGTAPTATEPSESKESSTETAPSDGPSEESPTPTPDKTIVDVTIDDNPVSPENYKKKPDGTVEFTPETIEGLTLGAHRVVIKYSDGSTKTIEFEVITSSRGNKIVKTGDVGGVDIVPVVSLFTIAAASLAIMLIRKRRSQHDEQ